MASLAQINVKFSADLKQFSSQMQNATRQVQEVGKEMTKVGKNLTVGITAPIVALGAASVIAFDKQAKAVAQVEAGLKSTGNAANKTSAELQALASGLQNNSLFGDEAILKDVTAQLLTFTNIAGQQFDRTQQAALDLATRLDGDLKSASIQLGKALNDPIANLSALSRSGIQFSKDQKAVIKSLTESGRLADAQTIILDELEKQYGGAAEAAAKAGLGPFKQLSNSIGDLTEDFGAIIVDALIPFIDYVKEVVKEFEDLDTSTKKVIAIVAALVAAIGPLLVALGFLLTTVIPGLISGFQAMFAVIAANPIGAAVVAITALGVAVAYMSGAFSDSTDAAQEFNEVMTKASNAVAREKVAIDNLVRTATNEKVSRQERTKAILELQRQYPNYFKNLNAEKATTEQITLATNKLTQALLQKAKVQAAEEKLVDVQKKLLDLQLAPAQNAERTLTDQYAALGTGAANAVTSSFKAALNGDDVLGAATLGFATGSISKFSDQVKESVATETAALTTLQNKLTDFISENQGLVQSLETVPPAVTPIVESVEELNSAIDKANIQPISVEIEPFKPSSDFSLIPPEVTEQFDEDLARMQESAHQFNQGLGPILEATAESFAVGFGELIANAAQGADLLAGLGSLMLGTMADLAIQVGKLAIQTGIAVAGIKASFESLNPALAIAAGVALVALGSFVKSSLGDIGGGATPFANGGIVSGPVNALVGEYAGARNNPEVIAPLNKLKGMLNDTGGGTAVIEGEFVLRGNDLVRVIRRQESRDYRTT